VKDVSPVPPCDVFRLADHWGAVPEDVRTVPDEPIPKYVVVADAVLYGKDPAAPPARFVAVVAVVADPTDKVDCATYCGAVPLDVKT
jgi:hypothetical protein